MNAQRSRERIIIVGGGAAGFFAASACVEAAPGAEILILEQGAQVLGKVRISGGGRCNVTHACFDPGELAARYPRGGRELVGPFHRFQPRDTVEWFAARGVALKVERDGRMFPTSDSSQTVVDCLMRAAQSSGVQLRTHVAVQQVRRRVEGGFELVLASGERLLCDRLLLTTGGCRTPAHGDLAVSLGHTLQPPVPSLFSFLAEAPWLRPLAGVSVPSAEASIPGSDLCARGPLLVTHGGVSGPAILELSAWGARELHARDYRFDLRVNWVPDRSPESIQAELQSQRQVHGARRVVNTPLASLPARLWEQLTLRAGLSPDLRWASLTRAGQQHVTRQLAQSEIAVIGKSLNKEEFVTCGGVRLEELDFRSMQSRLCPGLHCAGELLDIDGLTGGYNFQAAWTTGWIAGRSLAGKTA